ncbi:hypothetical protein CapIbe_011071 [Capra ibex]
MKAQEEGSKWRAPQKRRLPVIPGRQRKEMGKLDVSQSGVKNEERKLIWNRQTCNQCCHAPAEKGKVIGRDGYT